jgi:tripartite-type tricarboxylate transporter receptor subunit TctC
VNNRRTWLIAALAAPVLGATVRFAHAQADWPSRPIRLVIPFPPGGPTDNLARPLAQRLQDRLGQSVLIENRPGANGNIGAELVAKSPPDGHVLLWAPTGTMAVSPAIYPNLSFDPVRDFAPVSLVASVQGILIVRANAPWRTVGELIAEAKAKPGTLTFASPGSGSIVHLLGEQFKQLAGIDINHIPYKGGAPAMQDLLGGHVTMMFDSTASALNQARGGRVRMLATGAPQRLPQAPELPTMEEAGVRGFDSTSFHAIYAPVATPRPVVERLSAELATLLRSDELRTAYAPLGAEAVGSRPAELAAALRAATDRWGGLARRIGIKPE